MSRISRSTRAWLVGVGLAGALFLILPSCRKKEPDRIPLQSARGKVIFEGQPLAGAIVLFHSKASLTDKDGKPVPLPGGNTKEDGTFVVSTYRPGDGLPEGEYSVTVSCKNRNAAPIRDEYPELLPARYQNPAKSGLAVHIVVGKNDLPLFELKR